MGRKSIIFDLEAQIGQQLKPWLSTKIREGKTPEEIAAELSIGKSKVYDFIKEFGLKSVQKEVRKLKSSGREEELNQYLDRYFSEKRGAGLSEETIRKDQDLWNSYNWWLEFTGRAKTLFAIKDEPTITAFYLYLEAEKDRFGRHFKSGISKVTKLTYKKRMAAFFHWLIFKKILPKETDDPFSMMMKIKIPSRLPEDIPDEIIKMALDSFDNSFDGIRNKTITMWFLETGMRLGEKEGRGVTGIKMNQFDWERGVGRITEKGNKQRTIVLSDKLKAQVAKYLSLREGRTTSQSLWISSDGSPLTDSGVYRFTRLLNHIPEIKEALARLAPGERFHPHLYRHIWAKHLALSEVPGFAMMVMGGWENLELVHHYAAAYGQEKAWSYINAASPLSKIV